MDPRYQGYQPQGYYQDQPQQQQQYDQYGQPYQPQEYYTPPPGPPNGRGDGYYQPPTGAPPLSQYQPNAAGWNPEQEYQQGQQPPYGQQYQGQQRGDVQQYGPAFDDGQGHIQQHTFQYSKCNGRRKALLIGINYFGTDAELNGCINDVHNVQRFICTRFGYDPSDIVILTDDAEDPRQLPTRDNIIRGMHWLVADAHPDDALFLHYSGHGTQTEDLDGDEGDDDDEAICPLDYKEAGLIIDDESNHDLVVKPLAAGCRLTAIFDSCHSGTVMDLPYVYSTEGKIKEPSFLDDAGQGLMGAGLAYLRGDSGAAMSALFGAAKNAFSEQRAHEKTKADKTSPADVIMFSGCKDDQTSADTEEAGKATGAMSFAFIAALTKYPKQSYQQLLVTVREEMKGRYSQKPQLSACHPIDVDLEFVA